MAVDVSKVAWPVAGVIAVSSILGWIWIGSIFADEAELLAAKNEILEQMSDAHDDLSRQISSVAKSGLEGRIQVMDMELGYMERVPSNERTDEQQRKYLSKNKAVEHLRATLRDM